MGTYTYTYYVIMLGAGGQGSLNDIDYALRGEGKHQNDCILHEHFCITDFQSFKQEILIEWAAFGI